MKKLFWVPITLALAAYVLLPLPGQSAPLSKRIQAKRAQIEKKKRSEGVLSTTIQSYNARIDGLQGEIRGTEQRLTQVQSELEPKARGAASRSATAWRSLATGSSARAPS